MTQSIGRRAALRAIGAGVLVAGTASGLASAGHGSRLHGDLEAVRGATRRYRDPRMAYRDGYAALGEGGPIPLEDVTSEAAAVCNMGYHLVNPAHLEVVDRRKPQVLVYGEDEDGNLVLGAVEYVVPTAALPAVSDWFHGDHDDDHWEPFEEIESPVPLSALHVWVHYDNSNGVFHHDNPDPLFSPDGCLGH